MGKKQVEIIELNHHRNEYIVRSEEDYLKSLYKGSLFECIAYTWLMDCEVVNKDTVKELFITEKDESSDEQSLIQNRSLQLSDLIPILNVLGIETKDQYIHEIRIVAKVHDAVRVTIERFIKCDTEELKRVCEDYELIKN